MALKETIASLEDVGEALRPLYVERNGRYVLDVEGGVEDPAELLREARKARGDAEKALKGWTRQLGITDPMKAVEALQRYRELEEKDLLGPRKWEAAVERRAEEVAAELRVKEGTLIAEAKQLRSRLEDVQLENGIRSAAAKAGVLPAAMDDAVFYAKTVWKLKEGKPVAMNGDAPLYSSIDPTQPMALDEWVSERAKDRAHWFGPSRAAVVHQNGRQAGTVTLTREQAKDPAAYRAAKEQAEKTGGRLLIV